MDRYGDRRNSYTIIMSNGKFSVNYKNYCFPVEVGFRGFPAQSVWGALGMFDITGRERRNIIKEMGAQAEKASLWIWSKREEQKSLPVPSGIWSTPLAHFWRSSMFGPKRPRVEDASWWWNRQTATWCRLNVQKELHKHLPKIVVLKTC